VRAISNPLTHFLLYCQPSVSLIQSLNFINVSIIINPFFSSLIQIKSHAQKVLKRQDEAGENIFRRLDDNRARMNDLVASIHAQLGCEPAGTTGLGLLPVPGPTATFKAENDASSAVAMSDTTNQRQGENLTNFGASAQQDETDNAAGPSQDGQATAAQESVSAPTTPQRSVTTQQPENTAAADEHLKDLGTPYHSAEEGDDNNQEIYDKTPRVDRKAEDFMDAASALCQLVANDAHDEEDDDDDDAYPMAPTRSIGLTPTPVKSTRQG
jgi:hypothetical protein